MKAAGTSVGGLTKAEECTRVADTQSEGDCSQRGSAVDRSVREAQQLLEREESDLRGLSYEQLRGLKTPIAKEIVGPSGHTYDCEIEVFFDDRRKRTLRVWISISAWWGWGIVQPKELMRDFIVAPDGSFVGEEPKRSRWRYMARPNLRRTLAGLAVLVSAYVLGLIVFSRQPGILWRVGLGAGALLVLIDNLRVVLGKERWRRHKRTQITGGGTPSESGDPMTPIFTVEGHDVGIFHSRVQAENQLEPIDVSNGIFVAYDALGRRLDVRTDGRRTSISLPEPPEDASQEFEDALRHFLATAGEPEARDTECDLPCLVALARKHAERPR
jgi:hypothetical protein